ncbi:MAG: hypothetical protein J7496_04795 [Novosphingobium sp.]|nr:hypothetical protein [Novosphingobium sp.]
MRKFTLLLEDGGSDESPGEGETRRIEFDAVDTSAAFPLLERELGARRATLWEDDRRLGTIVRNDGDFWEISA